MKNIVKLILISFTWQFHESGDDCEYTFQILPEDLILMSEFVATK
jgi:hypothetical protein